MNLPQESLLEGARRLRSVSYTHLDVYKRQVFPFCAGGVAAAERVSVQAFCKLLWHDHTLPYI